MRLPWLACTVCCPFLTIFWFPFPLWLALLQDWALLNGGLCFFLAYPFSCYHLLPYHSIILVAKLFASILLGLFGPTVYSSPNGLVRPLVLLLHQWWAPVSNLFSLGHPGPVYFPWASSALFLTLHFHGFFIEFFGHPRPNYIISHPWGSWACHQPLTFFAFIALGLPWPILTFPHHILPMVCFFSLSELL